MDNDDFLKSDSRDFLVEEFERRKARRPSYTLRAFARDIGVDASRLTAFLTGKYGLSKVAALSIGEKLNFSKTKLDFFADLVESQHARSKAARDQAAARVEKARFDFGSHKIKIDTEEILRHWYYLATHQLVIISGQGLTVAKISKRLGISADEAQAALSYLCRTSIIKKIEDGFEVVERHISFDSPVPSKSVRNFHRDVLARTIETIEATPIAQRKNLSSFVSIDISRMAEAREWLTKAHQEFIKQFGTSENANRVYSLGSHFVPVEEETPNEN